MHAASCISWTRLALQLASSVHELLDPTQGLYVHTLRSASFPHLSRAAWARSSGTGSSHECDHRELKSSGTNPAIQSIAPSGLAALGQLSSCHMPVALVLDWQFEAELAWWQPSLASGGIALEGGTVRPSHLPGVVHSGVFACMHAGDAGTSSAAAHRCVRRSLRVL